MLITPPCQFINMARVSRSSLVVDPDAFLGGIERPIQRDYQLHEICACFAGKLASIRPIHAWAHGPPGTGKTLCVQYLLREHAQPPGFVALYVNCREQFTFLSVVEQILDQIKPLRNAQKARHRQLTLLRKALTGRRSVLVLDEIDVLPDRDATDLLHHLAVLDKTCLVCVASSRQPLIRLPESVRSRLAPRQILFPRYRPDELRQILDTTAQVCLRPGSWSEGTLEKIVQHSHGDARRMLALLRHAVQRAEEVGDDTLRPEHLRPSNFEYSDPSLEEQLAQLSSHHRLLYTLVRKHGRMAARALEETYQKACRQQGLEPVLSRTFVKYLSVLCRRRILARERGAGTSGWTYRVPDTGPFGQGVGPG